MVPDAKRSDGVPHEANFMSRNASKAVIACMSITMGWLRAKCRGVPLDRAPKRADRLVRRADGKLFEVAFIASLAQGELVFTLRSEDGERINATCGDLFPRRGRSSPYTKAG